MKKPVFKLDKLNSAKEARLARVKELRGKARISLEEAQELIDSGVKEFFVNNLSGKSKYKNSDLIINVTNDKNGRQITVVIPDTIIPWDLSLSANVQDVLDCSDFRKMHDKRLLEIVGPDYAKSILATEEAQDEIDRLNKSKVEASEERDVMEVSPRVMSIVENEENTWRSKLASLRSIAPALTEDDLNFIKSKAPESEARVHEFVKNCRLERR